MYWLQFSTFALFGLLILAMLAGQVSIRRLSLVPAQHAGAGEGACTVWQLIADIEAENAEPRRPRQRHATGSQFPGMTTEFPALDPDEPVRADQPTGRHRLRADHES